MDTYYTAACVLKRLVDHEAPEKQLQMDILTEIKNLVQHDKLEFSKLFQFVQLTFIQPVLSSH